MVADGTLMIDTKLDPTGFNTGVASLVKSLSALAISATAVVVGILGVQSVKATATLSAEFQRLRIAAQAVGQIYGIAAPESRKLIDDLKAQGIQSDAASRAFTNFAKEGLELNLLPALARGAQDLNTFSESGASSSDVFNGMLAGILKLDTQMLKSQGIVVDLQQAYRDYAASMGKSASALSTQEMRTAAMIAVIDKLKGVSGLYELSQKTAAGQLSSNKRIMIEFQNVIGGAFQDAFYNLIKSFNTFIKALTAAFSEGGKLRALWLNMAGVASLLSRVIKGLLDAMSAWLGLKKVAPAMTEVATSTSEAATAQEELAENIQQTAKVAKGALAAFDELNVLQMDTATASTPAVDPALSEIIPELQPVDADQIEDPLEEIRKKADELLKKFQELFPGVVEGFNDLKTALEPLGETIWAGLKWAWDNILVPLGGWVISDVLPVFLELLSKGAELLNTVLLALQPVWDVFWEYVLKPLAEWTGGVIVDFLGFLADALEGLSDWINNNQETFATMTTIVAGFIAAWKIVEFTGQIVTLTIKLWLAVSAWLASAAAKLADKIETLALYALYTGDFLSKIALSAIKLGTETIAWIASTAAKFAANAQLVILTITTTAWNIVGSIAATVTTAFASAMAFLASPIGLIILLIVGIIAVIWLLIANWKKLSTTFSQIWFLLGVILKGWTKMMESVFFIALDAVKGKFTTVFEGIKGFVKDIINSIIGFINGMIKGIVGGINAVVNAANSVAEAIPGYSPMSNVSAPQIPRLATGAVIPPNAQFAAILGDQTSGRNLEAPESLIRQIVREESGGGGEITIRFEGTMAQFVRELKPMIDKENSRVGGSLLSGGTA